MIPMSPTDYYGQFLLMVQTILLVEKEQIRNKVHEARTREKSGFSNFGFCVELEIMSGAMEVDPDCLRRQREEAGDMISTLASSYVWWHLRIFTQEKNNNWEPYTKTDWMKERPKWIMTVQDRKKNQEEAKKSKIRKSVKKREAKAKW